MKTGRLKILEMLWGLIALAGVIMIMMAFMVPLGNVHSASRTNGRLSDLKNAPLGFTPSVEQYRDSCTDAKYLWRAMGTMMVIGSIGGGSVTLLALVGLGITSSILKRQTNAQQSRTDDNA
jgi:ABC-type sugar transport system permease subunit